GVGPVTSPPSRAGARPDCRETERDQYAMLRATRRTTGHMRRTAMPRWAAPGSWGIRTKVVALAVASVAVTGVAMGGVSAWQSGRFADDAERDVRALVDEDISRTAPGVHSVVSTQGASTSAKVDSDLATAQYVLEQAGGFSIDD